MHTDFCIVVLTDSLYLPGTLKLLESWRHHNQPLPVVALSKDPETLADSRLRAITEKQVLLETDSYRDIQPYKKRRSRRHAETFYKFEAFRDFGYRRNLFLDSDILCLGPVPELLGENDCPLMAAPDTGFRKTRGYKGHLAEVNTGVLSIHRDLLGERTISQLKEIAQNEPGRGGYNSGDQGIVNKWIHRNGMAVSLLTPEYNLIKKDYSDLSGLETCRLLHFCDRKPWIKSLDQPHPLEELWFRGGKT
ncbi:glycosyltransferase [Pelagicoccus albus]|uniref:Glycosyl transferase family 8 n=1 Tax=Pelagicoccus albus TaxID=415222 RepID=A0A7X1B5N9_9BACT|nr:glycosyltransferase [Pelagicoccus albus]MBC2604860.1 hypothetical protein [Pelagicoccus albus]